MVALVINKTNKQLNAANKYLLVLELMKYVQVYEFIASMVTSPLKRTSNKKFPLNSTTSL